MNLPPPYLMAFILVGDVIDIKASPETEEQIAVARKVSESRSLYATAIPIYSLE